MSQLRRLAFVLGGLLLGLVLVVGFAWWRLERGPLVLDRYCNWISQRIGAKIAPLSLELGGASLVWSGWDAALEIRVREATLRRGDGQTLIELADGAIGLAKGPLLTGVVAPYWVEVDGIHAVLVRNQEGRIDFGLPERSGAAQAETMNLRDLTDLWVDPPNPDHPFGRLTVLRVRKASLSYEDLPLGLVGETDRIDIELNRGEALLEATIPLLIETGETSHSVLLDLFYRFADDRFRVGLTAHDLKPAAFARLDSPLRFLQSLDDEVDLRLQAEISDELALQNGELELQSQWGQLRGKVTLRDSLDSFDASLQIVDLAPSYFAELAPQVRGLKSFEHRAGGAVQVSWVDETHRSGRFRLQGEHWGEVSGEVRFEQNGPGRIGDGWTGDIQFERVEPAAFAEIAGVEALAGLRLPLAGKSSFEIEKGSLRSLELEVESDAGEVVLKDLQLEPQQVKRFELAASAEQGLDVLSIHRLAIDLDDANPRIKALATRRGGRYALQANATLERLDVRVLPTYLPRKKAEKVRKWIAENMLAGKVRDVVFDLEMEIEPGAEKAMGKMTMEGSMSYDEVVVDLLPPQPPVRGVSGTATFAEGRLSFDVASGAFEDFQIGMGRVVIAGLGGEQQVLEVGLAGPVRVATALGLLRDEPLRVLRPGFLEGLDGETKTSLQLSMMLSGPERELSWAAQAKASEVSWTDAPYGLRLSEGDFSIDASQEVLEVRGRGVANGLPVAIEVRHDPSDGDPSLSVELRSRVDEIGLQALGLPKQEIFSGTADVELHYARGRDGLADVIASIDLRDSGLEIAELDWRKVIGTPGQAEIVVRQQDQSQWRLESLELAAGDLEGSGSGSFRLDPFRIERLEGLRIEMPDHRIQASLEGMELDSYRLHVSGPTFDLRPPLARLRRAHEGTSESPSSAENSRRLPGLEIDLRFDQVLLAPELRLLDFEAAGEYDGHRWISAETSARIGSDIGPDESLELVYGPIEGGYGLDASTGRAGDLMAALTGSSRAQGGNLTISAKGPSPDGPFEGHVGASEILVTEDDSLVRILSMASLDGFVETLSDSHLKIRRAGVDFELADGVLDLRRGRAEFSGFWISFGGKVQFPNREVACYLAVAEHARLQRAVGRIPLIGRMATGRNQEGLFATHFRVEGPFENIAFEHLPLSTLTPGILRDVLGISGGKQLPEEDDHP